jgi:hypothetical protein
MTTVNFVPPLNTHFGGELHFPGVHASKMVKYGDYAPSSQEKLDADLFFLRPKWENLRPKLIFASKIAPKRGEMRSKIGKFGRFEGWRAGLSTQSEEIRQSRRKKFSY